MSHSRIGPRQIFDAAHQTITSDRAANQGRPPPLELGQFARWLKRDNLTAAGTSYVATAVASTLAQVAGLPWSDIAPMSHALSGFLETYDQARKVGVEIWRSIRNDTSVHFGPIEIAGDPNALDGAKKGKLSFRASNFFAVIPKAPDYIKWSDRVVNQANNAIGLVLDDNTGEWKLATMEPEDAIALMREKRQPLTALSYDSLEIIEEALVKRAAEHPPIKEAALGRELLSQVGAAKTKRLNELRKSTERAGAELCRTLGLARVGWIDQQAFEQLLVEAWPKQVPDGA